jgi:peptidoglycan/xylan/chitin deacetylase (PgdA/CDA1 family)
VAHASDRLRREAGRRAPGQPRAAILLYHRIADVDDDPLDLSVSPATFREHLAVLARDFRVVSIADLLRLIADRHPPSRLVAITFDDGYADNLEVAAPELERRQLPSTVYLATDYVERGASFWWDELAALLAGPEHPAPLVVDVNGSRREWVIADGQMRVRALVGLIETLQAAPPAAIAPALETVRAWADGAENHHRPARVLEPGDLERLTASGLVEIGAHTRHHPGLAAQSAAMARAEIQRSRRDIEEWTGRAAQTFSYPFGDWSTTTRRLAREAGFSSAVTIRSPAAVTRWSDRFALPRNFAANDGGAVLGDKLSAIL